MQNKIRIAVCEDEMKWKDEVEKYLNIFKQKHKNIEWGYFHDSNFLLAEYQHLEQPIFDIIITDIEMNSLSGVEMANKIREMDENVIIIFLTQYTKYMRECFISQPFRFWEKPIKYETFENDMNIVLEKIKQIHNRKSFAFTEDGISYRIPYNEIYYFEADLKKIIIHLKEKTYKFLGKMKDYAKKWEDNGFVGCHRSYFVNIEYVEHLEAANLYLTNGEWIPVSKSHLNDFKTYMLEAECREAVKNLREKRAK